MADGDTTYSQRDLDAAAAGARKEVEAKYANLRAEIAELRTKAGEADASKSDLAKLTDEVKALREENSKAKLAVDRRDVAEAHKIPKYFAERMTGKTKDDLDREAKEIVEMLKTMGVDLGKASGGKDGKGGDGSGGSGDGKGGEQNGSSGGDGGNAAGNGTSGDGKGDADGGKRSLLSGRPTETLKSGAGTSSGGQPVDASKIAESILDRSF
jgi:hypothetical protein